MQTAFHGYKVSLYDISATALDKAKHTLRGAW
ncbi:hypothetical protein QA640_46935 (plasmid) [Bradyrhizobium sp. CB82]|nr:hypothetical protein [Bradyrhizobium sp. CB82]WFU46138.1 hypothetical protein QA640_46935 [Bradyrhizobium sp. CB82]